MLETLKGEALTFLDWLDGIPTEGLDQEGTFLVWPKPEGDSEPSNIKAVEFDLLNYGGPDAIVCFGDGRPDGIPAEVIMKEGRANCPFFLAFLNALHGSTEHITGIGRYEPVPWPFPHHLKCVPDMGG